MVSVKQICAECDKPMKILSHGAYARCCNGRGYWANVPPSDNVKLKPRNGLWLYFYSGKKTKEVKL